MAKKRNYKAEYERRIANAARRGLSRSQARGHAKAGELPLKAKPISKVDIAPQFQDAIKEIRRSGNLTQAAKLARIAPERLRRFLRENDLITRNGRKWTVNNKLKWHVTVISDGDYHEVTLSRVEQASLNGKHQAAVNAFKISNDIELLLPFAGQSVIDANGKAYPLETNPNTLHRLLNAGSEVFHEIYRLTL